MNQTALKPACILFDLDGTLLDTAADFSRILNRMRVERGMAELPYSAIRETVSDGARAMVSLCFDTHEGAAGFDDLKTEFLDRYEQGLTQQTTPFEGIESMLEAIQSRDIAWGVVTNKPSRYTHLLMDHLGWWEPSATIICADDVPRAKPAPDALLKAAADAGVTTEQCWYVGDHRRDIEAASAAAMTSVACSYGFVHPDDPANEWQAGFVIDTPAQLIELLDNKYTDTTKSRNTA